MSFVDHIRAPGALSWLRNGRPVRLAEPQAAPLPSLASVEYELAQLRASLRGVVDFGDDAGKREAAHTPAVAIGTDSGLVRRQGLQAKLARPTL